mmetsp:Transcript_13939/g.35461  ORF Transcript_13939/g.35461 Transcript_13939/m.35461 type:complete len:225 (-) Transcript_13939:485-1159(-)
MEPAGMARGTASVTVESKFAFAKSTRLAHTQIATQPACVVAKNSPRGDHEREVAGDRSECQAISLAVGRSCRRSAPSRPEVSSRRPSGEKARSVIVRVCPSNWRTSSCARTSKMRTLRSSHATATSALSIEPQSLATEECACMQASCSRVCTDHRRTVPSCPALTSILCVPSITRPRTAPRCPSSSFPPLTPEPLPPAPVPRPCPNVPRCSPDWRLYLSIRPDE